MFFCGKDLEKSDNDIGGLVYWSGENNSPLALHQSCAILLAINLIQDSRSLVTKTGEEMKISANRKKDIKEIWFFKNK
jgi:hypothetical protein